jgi:hypothetical protein
MKLCAHYDKCWKKLHSVSPIRHVTLTSKLHRHNVLLLRGSTVHVRTLATSHTGRFLILCRHLVGLLWTSDQPVAKASAYTDNNTERQVQTSMP